VGLRSMCVRCYGGGGGWFRLVWVGCEESGRGGGRGERGEGRGERGEGRGEGKGIGLAEEDIEVCS